MASNWLTDGRLAMLDRLQSNSTLSSTIKTWYEWGPGLIERFDPLDHAACPQLSVVPASLSEEEPTNITNRYPQELDIGVATSGQDAEPLEELVTEVLSEIAAARADGLGLDGLANVELDRVRWAARPSEEGADIIWMASHIVTLTWIIAH